MFKIRIYYTIFKCINCIEHLRYAKHPNCNSYSEEAFAVHYKQQHPNTAPQLQFKILLSENSTIRRKILESFFINTLQPEINNKEEMPGYQKIPSITTMYSVYNLYI